MNNAHTQNHNKIKKDYKRMKKQGGDLKLLETVIDDLLSEKTLDAKHHDHPLSGNYVGFRECHILPDWFLIYTIDQGQLLLIASRTVSHSELFDE